MKKAIVLLLALAVLGGAAFAQVKTSISFSGRVTLIDQDGNGVFAQDGNHYDTLTFKATSEDGLFGFSITDENLFDGSYDNIRDWNAYYKIFDSKARVMVGNLRNGDFRVTLPYGRVTNRDTNRIGGYGVLTTVYPVDGLSFGVNLPYNKTSEEVADTFQKADIGAKYVIADVGTAIALFDLNLVTDTNVLNLGFTLSSVENLTAVALYKGTFAASATHAFGFGANYNLDALSLYAEFSGTSAAAFIWDAFARAEYQILDNLGAGVEASFASDETYDVTADVTYNLVKGLDLGASIGFDGDLHFDVGLYYAISF